VYDFLLAINSNLGPISHCYRDTATYWQKITNFTHPLSFSALVRGDPVRVYVTDRQTDRIAMAKTRWKQ